MIQRIQSIFLLLAAGSMALLFTKSMSFITILGDTSALRAAEQAMLGDGVFETNDHIILSILVLATITLPIIALFLYKNRSLQMKLGRLTITLVIIVFALAIILFMSDYKLIKEGTEVSIEYGFLAPFLAILFAVLALRGIKKDDKLVRSSDRLR